MGNFPEKAENLNDHWKALHTEACYQALKSIFDALFEELYQYSYRITGSQPIAQDALQNTFVDIWQYRKSLAPKVNVRAYMFSSVRNHCLRILIRQKQNIDSANLAEAMEFVPEDLELNDTAFDFGMEISQALTHLSPRQREIIYLKFHDDHTYQEIAAILGIRYQSVINHSHSAIKKLRLVLTRKTAFKKNLN